MRRSCPQDPLEKPLSFTGPVDSEEYIVFEFSYSNLRVLHDLHSEKPERFRLLFWPYKEFKAAAFKA